MMLLPSTMKPLKSIYIYISCILISSYYKKYIERERDWKKEREKLIIKYLKKNRKEKRTNFPAVYLFLLLK